LYEILKVAQDDIYKLQRGQAQPHVYPKDISKIKIPIPSIEQQKKTRIELKKLDKNRGKILTKGTSIDNLENVLQEKKRVIIKKICF